MYRYISLILKLNLGGSITRMNPQLSTVWFSIKILVFKYKWGEVNENFGGVAMDW